VIGVAADGTSTIARQSTAELTFPNVVGTPEVVLEPGNAAVAALAGSDTPANGPCPPPYHDLKIGPPGQDATVTLSGFNEWLGQDTPACAGLRVTMVIPESAVPFLDTPAPRS
jgi:hypothetical protein